MGEREPELEDLDMMFPFVKLSLPEIGNGANDIPERKDGLPRRWSRKRKKCNTLIFQN